MKEILSFFKEIFMLSDEKSDLRVGLSQLKVEEQKEPEVKVAKVSKDIKLSDLMRRSA